MFQNTKPAIYNMVIVGLMTAVLCIVGPWSLTLSLSPVPLSFCTLAIYFITFILGAKRGSLSVLIYLLLGLIGLPVFSGFYGGVGKLLGPTGGYLLGYLLMTSVSGFFVDKFSSPKPHCHFIHFLGFLLGTGACYLIGSLWLSYQMQLTFYQTLTIGVIPYIPFDFIKIILAVIIGPNIQKKLIKAGLI